MDNRSSSSKWTCPDDRELALRSRIKAGWSTRTTDLDRGAVEGLSDAEKQLVEDVLRRAVEDDLIEQERIGRLVNRVENMKKTSFDGFAKCAMCGDSIKAFGKSSLVCSSCHKGVCNECGSGVRDETTMEIVVVCKLCEEMRELWKKTGAWFYGQLPTYVKSESLRQTQMRRSQSPADVLLDDGSDEPESSSENELDNFFLRPPGTPVYGKKFCRADSTSQDAHPLRRTPLAVSDTNLRPIALNRSPSPSSTSLGGNTPSKARRRKFGGQTSADEIDGNAIRPEPLLSSSSSRQSSPHGTRNVEGLRTKKNGALATPSQKIGGGGGGGGWRDKIDADRLQMFGSKQSVAKTSQKKQDDDEEDEEDIDVDELFKQVQADKGISVSQEDDVDSDVGAGSRFGAVYFGVLYDFEKKDLCVRVTKCTGLKMFGHSGPINSFVKLHLLPGHMQSRELKTGVRTKNDSPVYNDRLLFPGVTEEDWKEKTLRLSVYHRSAVTHQFQCIGETRLPLKNLPKNKDEKFVKHLEKIALTERDTAPLQHDRGALQVSLQYQTDKKKLVVGILQAVGLPPMDSNGLADPYVKCYLLPDKNKKTKQKTYVAKKTLNPEYNKEFFYDVELNELASRKLDLTVWDHDIARHNDFIGGVQLHSKGTGLALSHWYSTLKYPGKRFVYWHKLSLVAQT
ncbi:rabphilin-3A-like isoform X2 [Oscarella lobularis]|uniref:rabphilin-3A-like isoform X2 n=1 Tax=Oscarella lobularis TaxID=121494 RepID=UPI003313A4BB